MDILPLRLLLLALLLLSSCATPSPAMRAWEETARNEATSCESQGADQCIVLACDAGECGVFGCEDVAWEVVAHTSRDRRVELARGYRPPARGPGPSRNWRRTGLRDDAHPRMTFHFRYRHGFLPAFPRLEGKLVKHHLFPQEPRLAEWFKAQGIDIHAWTMVIPEHIHLRIHRGARGGPWNDAWREFLQANRYRRMSQEELLRKAFELAFRFDIVGPIIPYSHQLVPEGPQLLAP